MCDWVVEFVLLRIKCGTLTVIPQDWIRVSAGNRTITGSHHVFLFQVYVLHTCLCLYMLCVHHVTLYIAIIIIASEGVKPLLSHLSTEGPKEAYQSWHQPKLFLQPKVKFPFLHLAQGGTVFHRSIILSWSESNATCIRKMLITENNLNS